LVFDNNYEAYYYFNTQTGESEWVEDVEAGEGAEKDADLDEIELTRIATESLSGSTTKRSGKQEDDEEEEEEEEEDDDGGVSLITDADRVRADTQSALTAHMRCMFLTACLCESPLAVAEGVVRSASFFAGCVIFSCVAVVSPSTRTTWIARAKECGREMLLTSAAVLTLLLPCTACLVYRKYDDEEEWDLAPLPTVLGWVDSQRFAVFTMGGGALARVRSGPRGEASGSSSSSRDDLAGTLDFHDSRSADSWGSGILIAPRKILKSLLLIARGEAEAAFQDDLEMHANQR
jgi:hypothetical protein